MNKIKNKIIIITVPVILLISVFIIKNNWEVIASTLNVIIDTVSQNNLNGWTNKDLNITVSSSDIGGSGIAQLEVRKGSKTGTLVSSNITGGEIKFKADSNANYYLMTRDKAGNETNYTLEVKNIDKILPESPKITINPDKEKTNKDVIFKITDGVDSGGSEVSKSEYKIDSGDWVDYTSEVTISKEGKTTIYARTLDKAGNKSPETECSVDINTTKPIITPNNYTKTPTNQDITVNVETDKGTLNESSHKFTKNGEFTFTSTDEYGNVEELKVVIDNIVKTKPELKLSGDKEDEYRTKHEIELNIVPTSPAEVSTKKYQWILKDGIIDESKWEDIPSNNIITSPGDTGEYILHVKVKDNAGNENTLETSEFKVDTTPPTVPTITPSTTSPTNQDVNISINPGQDDHSGVDYVEYRIDSGEWKVYLEQLVLSENCIITARTVDRAGNSSSESLYEITNIDKTPPKITFDEYDFINWTNQSITVKAYTDKGSLNQSNYTFHQNESFEFIAMDLAGNVSKETVTIANIDKISQIPEIEVSGTAFENQKITINNKNPDGMSPITKLEYSLDNVKWESINDPIFPVEINLQDLENGKYVLHPNIQFHARITDGAGNVTETDNQTSNDWILNMPIIDLDIPLGVIDIIRDYSGPSNKSSNVTIINQGTPVTLDFSVTEYPSKLKLSDVKVLDWSNWDNFTKSETKSKVNLYLNIDEEGSNTIGPITPTNFIFPTETLRVDLPSQGKLKYNLELFTGSSFDSISDFKFNVIIKASSYY